MPDSARDLNTVGSFGTCYHLRLGILYCVVLYCIVCVCECVSVCLRLHVCVRVSACVCMCVTLVSFISSGESGPQGGGGTVGQ